MDLVLFGLEDEVVIGGRLGRAGADRWRDCEFMTMAVCNSSFNINFSNKRPY